MKLRVIVAAMVTVMLLPALTLAGNVVIIGNSSVPVSELSKKDIGNIFLGKRTAWEDDSKVIFVVLNDAKIQKAFLKEFVNKSLSQYDRFWKKQVFTGKGSSPRAYTSEKELVKYVSETKGAIGYVLVGTNLDAVKTIRVK